MTARAACASAQRHAPPPPAPRSPRHGPDRTCRLPAWRAARSSAAEAGAQALVENVAHIGNDAADAGDEVTHDLRNVPLVEGVERGPVHDDRVERRARAGIHALRARAVSVGTGRAGAGPPCARACDGAGAARSTSVPAGRCLGHSCAAVGCQTVQSRRMCEQRGLLQQQHEARPELSEVGGGRVGRLRAGLGHARWW